MSLGTRNRLIHNATLCGDHLRKGHGDKLALVNEFIAEIEREEAAAAWNRFTDLKRSEREMLQRVAAEFERWLNP